MEYGWFVAAASSSSFLFPPPSFRLFLQKITCWYPLWCTYTQRITFSGTPFRGFIYGCTTGCSLCWFLGLTEIIGVRAISGWFLGYPRPHTRARLFSHILLSTVAHIFMHSVSLALSASLPSFTLVVSQPAPSRLAMPPRFVCVEGLLCPLWLSVY